MSLRIAAFLLRFAAPLLRIALPVLLSSVATVAIAQMRTIPADAKRGRVAHVQDMIVAIDGKPYRLAPGARIRGPSNTFLVPMAIPNGARARYVLDADGSVRSVWILSPRELASEPPEQTTLPANGASQ